MQFPKQGREFSLDVLVGVTIPPQAESAKSPKHLAKAGTSPQRNGTPWSQDVTTPNIKKKWAFIKCSLIDGCIQGF